MAASIWSTIRTKVRRRLRDEDAAAYVFTNDELLDYMGNAVRAYSEIIPREIIGSLALTADEDEYDEPDNCREIVSILSSDEATEYVPQLVFGGKIKIDPTPSAADTAIFKYRGIHTIPDSDDDASSYDSIDEHLIIRHIIAQAYETLAGDGAKYYQYREGDIEENQGKTQAQFRAEADRMFAEFDAGVRLSASTLKARRATPTTPTVAAVITRTAASRNASIYKST